MRNLIWLASYPKSGNTWARMFVAAYLSGAESFDLKQVHQFSRSESLLALFADIAGKPSTELSEEDISTHRLAVQERLARNVGQRVVKTHNARLTRDYRRLVFSRFTRAGIYVVRNPLDVVDSLADHTNKSLDEAIELMNESGHRLGATDKHAAQFVGTWSHHVRTWINNADEFPLIVLRYEDLKANPYEGFGNLIKFLGWQYDEQRVRRAVDLTSFESLQRAEDVDGFAEASAIATSGRFFRHGQCGRWREILTATQAARVIVHHREMMEMLGYEVPVLDSGLVRGGRPAVGGFGEVGRPAPSAKRADGDGKGSGVFFGEAGSASEQLLAEKDSRPRSADIQQILTPRTRSKKNSNDKREAAAPRSPTTPGAPDETANRPLIAYEIYQQTDMPLTPAPINRPWMDDTQHRYAYRCLPLTLANQAGWVIGNPTGFTVYWNGGPRVEDVVLTFDNQRPEKRISSLFGHGVVTFNMPYLFRTPENINLWVKGPTNSPKDGVHALEGIVETDWTAASFTMNWKLTRPNHVVRFDVGEPICMVVPYPRGLPDSLSPRRQALDSDAEVSRAYRRWSADRDEFHRLVAAGDKEAIERGWQKDYFQGRDPGSERVEYHQTKLTVRPFESS